MKLDAKWLMACDLTLTNDAFILETRSDTWIGRETI